MDIMDALLESSDVFDGGNGFAEVVGPVRGEYDIFRRLWILQDGTELTERQLFELQEWR